MNEEVFVEKKKKEWKKKRKRMGTDVRRTVLICNHGTLSCSPRYPGKK